MAALGLHARKIANQKGCEAKERDALISRQKERSLGARRRNDEAEDVLLEEEKKSLLAMNDLENVLDRRTSRGRGERPDGSADRGSPGLPGQADRKHAQTGHSAGMGELGGGSEIQIRNTNSQVLLSSSPKLGDDYDDKYGDEAMKNSARFAERNQYSTLPRTDSQGR